MNSSSSATPQNRLKVEDVDYDNVADEVAAELLRQAELRLESVFTAALGMDSRAAVIGSAFAASAGALIAGGLAIPDAHPIWRTTTFSEAAMLMVAAFAALYACRPQKFMLPGIDPDDWAQEAFLQNSIKALNFSRAATIAEILKKNESQQAKNGKSLAFSLWFAALSPLLSISAFLVSEHSLVYLSMVVVMAALAGLGYLKDC